VVADVANVVDYVALDRLLQGIVANGFEEDSIDLEVHLAEGNHPDCNSVDIVYVCQHAKKYDERRMY
jgi:hypothetical protein